MTGAGREPGEEAAVRAAVRQLWLRNRATTLERVSVVHGALVSLSAGDLEPAARAAAREEAHKLRGILGTYGFDAGSDLAGEAEEVLDDGGDGRAALDLAGRLDAYLRVLSGS